MPRVPVLDAPRVSTGVPQLPQFQNPLSRGEAAQAGQQLQQAGRAMQQAAGAFGAIAMQEQDEYNNLRLNDAMNRGIEARHELTFGQNGYSLRRGRDTQGKEGGFRFVQDYVQQYQTQLDEIANALDNDAQRAAFAQIRQKELAGFQQEVTKHERREYERHTLAVSKDTQQFFIETAATQADNPEAIADFAARARAAIATEGKLLGRTEQGNAVAYIKLAAKAFDRIKAVILGEAKGQDAENIDIYGNLLATQASALGLPPEQTDVLIADGHRKLGEAMLTDIPVGKLPKFASAARQGTFDGYLTPKQGAKVSDKITKENRRQQREAERLISRETKKAKARARIFTQRINAGHDVDIGEATALIKDLSATDEGIEAALDLAGELQKVADGQSFRLLPTVPQPDGTPTMDQVSQTELPPTDNPYAITKIREGRQKISEQIKKAAAENPGATFANAHGKQYPALALGENGSIDPAVLEQRRYYQQLGVQHYGGGGDIFSKADTDFFRSRLDRLENPQQKAQFIQSITAGLEPKEKTSLAKALGDDIYASAAATADPAVASRLVHGKDVIDNKTVTLPKRADIQSVVLPDVSDLVELSEDNKARVVNDVMAAYASRAAEAGKADDGIDADILDQAKADILPPTVKFGSALFASTPVVTYRREDGQLATSDDWEDAAEAVRINPRLMEIAMGSMPLSSDGQPFKDALNKGRLSWNGEGYLLKTSNGRALLDKKGNPYIIDMGKLDKAARLFGEEVGNSTSLILSPSRGNLYRDTQKRIDAFNRKQGLGSE